MKCTHCGKKIDEVDRECKMCTICGWGLPTKDTVSKEGIMDTDK